jgi:hypothetical protein
MDMVCWNWHLQDNWTDIFCVGNLDANGSRGCTCMHDLCTH